MVIPLFNKHWGDNEEFLPSGCLRFRKGNRYKGIQVLIPHLESSSPFIQQIFECVLYGLALCQAVGVPQAVSILMLTGRKGKTHRHMRDAVITRTGRCSEGQWGHQAGKNRRGVPSGGVPPLRQNPEGGPQSWHLPLSRGSTS